MRIALLNQFLPPEQPPTARLVGDLAEALRAAGHEVVCCGAAGRYGAARGWRRVLRDITAHLSISWGVLCAGRLDWIVCLSDPTGLPLTARVLATLKGARLAHWAMDVYPQIALALGAVKDGLVVRLVAAGMRTGYRGCNLLVALDADMAAEISRVADRQVAVLPPWPPEVVHSPQSAAAVTGGHGSLRWLYSGNLGRAHEFETLLQAQGLLEARGLDWELHFQGGGPRRAEAEALSGELGLQKVRWSGYVPEEALLSSLLEADVLVATQRTATRGLLWPSKLALMRHLGLPIVWVGPEQGAVAEWLREQTVPLLVIAPGQARVLADWIAARPPRAAACAPEDISEKVRTERLTGCIWWLEQLQNPA